MTAVLPTPGSSALPMPMAAALPPPVQWAPSSNTSGFGGMLRPLCDQPAIKIVQDFNITEMMQFGGRASRHSIRNQLNQQVYLIIDTAPITRYSRLVNFEVLDSINQLCLKITSPHDAGVTGCCQYGMQMKVFSGDSRLLGDIDGQMGSCTPSELNIRDEAGNLVYKAKPSFDSIDSFVVFSGNDSVGSFVGDVQSVFNSEVTFPAGADPTARALLLAAGLMFMRIRIATTSQARQHAARRQGQMHGRGFSSGNV